MDYHVTEEEYEILMKKYGLRFRTASEFGIFDEKTKNFVMKLMELAYNMGKYNKKQLD